MTCQGHSRRAGSGRRGESRKRRNPLIGQSALSNNVHCDASSPESPDKSFMKTFEVLSSSEGF